MPAVAGEVGRGKRKDCHERALGLLAVRQRSRRELERRLSGAGFDDDEVTATLQRLESVGLVDDVAFARSVAEHAGGRKLEARRVVAQRLARAGVASDVAATVLDDTLADEQERADRLAEERVSRVRALPYDQGFRRLHGYLVRRGYTFEIARRAASRALGGEAQDT